MMLLQIHLWFKKHICLIRSSSSKPKKRDDFDIDAKTLTGDDFSIMISRHTTSVHHEIIQFFRCIEAQKYIQGNILNLFQPCSNDTISEF